MVVAAEVKVIQRPVRVQQGISDHHGTRLVSRLIKVDPVIAVSRLVIGHAGRQAERNRAEEAQSEYLEQSSVYGTNVPQALRTCLNGL
jgi:hypothetical protein